MTASDFEIREDGVPQQIEAFEFIKAAPFVVDADRRDPDNEADGERLAANPRNRVFVLYVDVYNIRTAAGAYYGRKPLIDFLDRAIGPGDLIGILTPLVPVRRLAFGRKVQVIQASLENYWQQYWVPDPDPVEEQYHVACPSVASKIISRRRADALFSSLEELVLRLGVLRDERKNVILLSDGWTLPGPDLAAAGRHTPSLPPINVVNGRLTTELPPGTASRSECDHDLARLTAMDFQERFRQLLTAAAQANVAFHPVSPSGLAVFEPSAAAARITGDSLRTLASNTNGLAVVHTNDIHRGLALLEARQSAFYLLGYYSTNLAADGKYRRIDVRVKQRGVEVTARRGYLAPTGELLRAGEAAASARPSEPSAVDLALAALARVRSSADLLTYAVPTSTGLTVVAEIANGRATEWRAGGDVEVSLTTPAGQTVATERARIEPGTRATLVRMAVGASAPPWRLGVRVAGAGRVLTDRLDVPAARISLLGAPLAFRSTPSPSAPLRPVADFLFRRTERVRIECPIVKPLDRHEARLLDRRGQALGVKVSLTEQEGSGGAGRVLAADVVLAPLADADYVVEIVASSGSEQDRRLVAIRVMR